MAGTMCEGCPDAAKAEVQITLLDGGGRSLVCGACLRRACDKILGDRVSAPVAKAASWLSPEEEAATPAPAKVEGWL